MINWLDSTDNICSLTEKFFAMSSAEPGLEMELCAWVYICARMSMQLVKAIKRMTFVHPNKMHSGIGSENYSEG